MNERYGSTEVVQNNSADTINYSRPQAYGQTLDFDLNIFMISSLDKPTHRRLILKDTLEKFKTTDYAENASHNLARWSENTAKTEKTKKVVIENMDWGDATLKYTSEYGTTFACLNIANPYLFPGGTYNLGGSGQEENMFRRTDCHFRITSDKIERAGPVFSRYWKYWKYNSTVANLINATNGQVYLSKEPRICIKGAETLSLDLGYELLKNDDIFSFYELRCAPIDRRFPLPPKRNMREDRQNMSDRITAQFETLKDQKVRHVILGAFGCGPFRNNPFTIANIYKEVIQRYIESFEVIVFAIPHSPRHIYEAFDSVFKATPQINIVNNSPLPDTRTESQKAEEIAEEIAEEFLMLARDRINELRNILNNRSNAKVTIACSDTMETHNLATSPSTETAWNTYYGKHDYTNRARELFWSGLHKLFEDLKEEFNKEMIRVSYGRLDRSTASLDHFLVWGAYTDTYESTPKKVENSVTITGGQQAIALSPHTIGLFGIIAAPGDPLT